MPAIFQSSALTQYTGLENPVNRPAGKPALQGVGDVPLCGDQDAARDADDSFIRPAADRRRELANGVGGDVGTDDGKIAALQFQDVRAGVGVMARGFFAEATKEFQLRAHLRPTLAPTDSTSKHKIPAIAGLVPAAFPYPATVAARLSHRKALAQSLRQYRKKAKLTQEKLGELADLNPKYIGEVERMEKTISVDALARIATALKVRLRDLLRDA